MIEWIRTGSERTEARKQDCVSGNRADRDSAVRGLFMPRLVIIFVTMLYAFSVSAAVQVNRLYEAEVQVNDEGAGTRGQAIQQGLIQVLTRVSGQARGEISARPKIVEAMAVPARYVVRYEYRQQGDKTRIWIKFNRSSVNRLLLTAGLPVWGQLRPETLVWLAIEDGGRRTLLSSATQSEVKKLLQQNGRRRGVPLRFPLMDLQDTAKVRFSDLRIGFTDNVEQASERYQLDAVLVGYMRWQGPPKGWIVKWRLIAKGNRQAWTASGMDKAKLIGSGIDMMAVRLAKLTVGSSQVATRVAGKSQFFVSVSNINSLEDYANVDKYLRALSVVTAAKVVKLSDSKAVFAVSTNVSSEAVQQAIAGTGVLVKEEDKTAMEDPNFSRTGETPDNTQDLQNTVFYRYKKQ